MDEFSRSYFPLSTSLAEARVRDVDDWSGVADSRQRRRIQNRRNQRARRAKKRGECDKADNESPAADEQLVSTRADPTRLPGYAGWFLEVHGAEATKAIIRAINLVNILDPNSERNRLVMQRFEDFASRSYAIRVPELSILPSLSQYNFVRALMANIDVLGLSTEEMDDEAFSPFNAVAGPVRVNSTRTSLSQLPAGLQPTELQCTALHHPWIDLLPVPAMRDNILRRELDSPDEEELCHAMRGLTPDHNPGMLVWRDPWDSTGWEVTEEFARSSWGWVIAGCRDLLRSTNNWRAQRGENPLFLLPS
ncbi:hypothetical protein F4677DRAFT_451682 [Hypoxylon crocopeplum]|nr:hypothetical protein F4677DRAFT_451682 [Hypoxylon crocopeplum]